MMPRRPRFDFGGATFEATIPARAWTPGDETIGGSRTSAAGVPASYVVRRDRLLDVTLRFLESEWEDVRDLVEFGQSAELFTWYPDANDLAQSAEVYLISPKPGEKWAPVRSADYPRAMELTITLRCPTAPLWLPYFA